MQFSHWFHPTPNGSWTNYGANTAYSMRAGWSNFNGTDEQADWLAGNPIKVRCGIDENGYISIETLRDGSTWVVHARSGYSVPQGSSYHLGIKSQSTSARVFSAPKVHLLEPEAPTMYFRYIESPDGVYNYPVFVTEEEANSVREVLISNKVNYWTGEYCKEFGGCSILHNGCLRSCCKDTLFVSSVGLCNAIHHLPQLFSLAVGL